MSKPMKKKVYYNTEILTQLEKKYGFTSDYIRKCLRGDRTGVMPDQIAKEYKTLENVSNEAIKQKVNQPQ
jgi:predicted ATP-dependent Lon-type protease